MENRPAAALPRYAKLSYGQQGEDMVLQRILRGILKLPKDYQGFYLDIGAFHPSRDSVTKLLYDQGWWGICVDMSETSIDLFRQERPRDLAICSAVGDRRGTITAYFSNSSISAHNTCAEKGLVGLRRAGAEPSEREVPIRTLNDILAEFTPHMDQIDFVNIDVEGFELPVMRGLDFDRYKPRVVALEIKAKGVEAALTSEVATHIKSLGYRCVGSCVITYFFVRN